MNIIAATIHPISHSEELPELPPSLVILSLDSITSQAIGKAQRHINENNYSSILLPYTPLAFGTSDDHFAILKIIKTHGCSSQELMSYLEILKKKPLHTNLTQGALCIDKFGIRFSITCMNEDSDYDTAIETNGISNNKLMNESHFQML